MSSKNRATTANDATIAKSSKLRWAGVLFAIVFPSIITWAYFVLAGMYSTGAQQATFSVVKVVQFAFPVIWVWLVLREPLRTGKASAQGLLLGAAFSVLVVGAGWLLFDRMLRDAAIFASAAALIRDKIGGFGIDSMWKYAVLGAFYSLFHSLLEEYYWRWFVFRQLRRLVPLWPAIIVSALGFMGHHVILLNTFFNDAPWLAWLLSSAVAMGGVFWAWLYERTGSLFGPWLSHMLIDAGIFWVGYDLIRETIAR
jgi:membrane protease YdiL (CAAX protease family)